MINLVTTSIVLGDTVLIRDERLRWDFYKNEHGDNPQRLTCQEFISVEVIGNVVYGRKYDKKGELLGIYDLNGNVKLYPKRVIDCGESFLGKNHLDSTWDFYTKQGERITDKEFSSVEIFGDLIRVVKDWFISFEVGVYNSKGEEIIPMDYHEDLFIVADKDKNPVCIADKVFYNCWKIYNLDGTTMTEMEDIYIKEINVIDVETGVLQKHRYLEMTVEFGDLGWYEISDGKLIAIVSPYDGYKIFKEDIEFLKTGFRMKKDGKLYYYSFDSGRIIDIT